MTLPYPPLDAWRVHATRPVRRWPAVFWAVIATGLAIAMVAANLRGDVGGGILQAVLFGALTTLLSVTYQQAGSERGLPHFINAVVLTRAVVQPRDSWIHFFREQGPSRWFTTCIAVAGLLAAPSLLWTAITAVSLDAGLWLLVIVPLLLIAVFLAFVGVLAIAKYVRFATFGQRPIGISLGRHGLTRYYLDGVDEWPWESIARVEAQGATLDAEGDFTADLVIVATERPEGITYDKYDIATYESHAWLIYTAARFWAEHPEHRTELGTTFAQRRIEGWRDAIVAQGSGASRAEG
jgi:hypothetical protein